MKWTMNSSKTISICTASNKSSTTTSTIRKPHRCTPLSRIIKHGPHTPAHITDRCTAKRGRGPIEKVQLPTFKFSAPHTRTRAPLLHAHTHTRTLKLPHLSSLLFSEALEMILSQESPDDEDLEDERYASGPANACAPIALAAPAIQVSAASPSLSPRIGISHPSSPVRRRTALHGPTRTRTHTPRWHNTERPASGHWGKLGD